MRHTFLLVAALGLIAVAGPSALAQEQEPVTPSTQPAALPATYTQPAMPGQAISPYSPTHSGMVTPCGGVMPSAHFPGTVQFGTQYQPFTQYGSFPQNTTPYGPVTYGQPGMQYAQSMMQYGQPSMQYGQPTVMPVAGSVAGGVMTQPYQTGTLLLNGTNTYQSSQPGMMFTNGMAYQPTQPGMVFQAGSMGAYTGQPVMLTGYTNGYMDTGMTTTQSGRRGLFGRRR